jgi:hypothetical protein
MIMSPVAPVAHVAAHPCVVQPSPAAQTFPQARQLALSCPVMSAQ